MVQHAVHEGRSRRRAHIEAPAHGLLREIEGHQGLAVAADVGHAVVDEWCRDDIGVAALPYPALPLDLAARRGEADHAAVGEAHDDEVADTNRRRRAEERELTRACGIGWAGIAPAQLSVVGIQGVDDIVDVGDEHQVAGDGRRARDGSAAVVTPGGLGLAEVVAPRVAGAVGEQDLVPNQHRLGLDGRPCGVAVELFAVGAADLQERVDRCGSQEEVLAVGRGTPALGVGPGHQARPGEQALPVRHRRCSEVAVVVRVSELSGVLREEAREQRQHQRSPAAGTTVVVAVA